MFHGLMVLLNTPKKQQAMCPGGAVELGDVAVRDSQGLAAKLGDVAGDASTSPEARCGQQQHCHQLLGQEGTRSCT